MSKGQIGLVEVIEDDDKEDENEKDAEKRKLREVTKWLKAKMRSGGVVRVGEVLWKDFLKRYLRKRRKHMPKRQKPGLGMGKDCERQSQIEAEKSIKSKSQQKSQLVKVKVNPSQPRQIKKSTSQDKVLRVKIAKNPKLYVKREKKEKRKTKGQTLMGKDITTRTFLSSPKTVNHQGRVLQRVICLGVDLELDKWIKDIGCSKRMMGNRKLFSTYKAYNGGNVIFGSNLRGNIIGKGQICDNKCRVTFSKHDSEITKDGKVIGDIKEPLDKGKEGICQRNKEYANGIFFARRGSVDVWRDNMNLKFKYQHVGQRLVGCELA
ncbi:hypothetical protein Tco_0563790 [Tanacetum coccineum]